MKKDKKFLAELENNLGDINGNRSTLYQDLGKDVFGEDTGLFYCTEAVTKELIKPLGEWP